MRFYRALLYLYPAWFRNEYRDELCRAFAERVRGRSTLAMVAAAIADVVPNAIGAHRDTVRGVMSGGFTGPTLSSDVRLAVRQIAHTPLFSGVVIAVIALGIGINAGLMTTLHTVAWQPAPGIEPDAKLVRLTPMTWSTRGNRWFEAELSYPAVVDLRQRRDVFADLAAWASTWLAADFGSGAETVEASFTTANFFRVLRVPMAAGAVFPDGTDRADAPIVVIGHSLWVSNFGGSPDAIGKTIRVMNKPYTIVGVAPPRFVGLDVEKLGRPVIWLPLGTRATLEPDINADLTRRDTAFLKAFGRLAPRVNAGDVDRMTGALATRLAGQGARTRLVIRAQRLTGLTQGESSTKELFAAFFIVTILVVIITCTNVSALLLGRAVARRREIGVRLSLGATRLRIIRQLLTESLVLALAGALVGLLLYVAAVKIAYATIQGTTYGLEPEPATFLFAAVFAVITTIAFGLAPALHASRADIAEVIKNSGTLAIRRSRLQATFVVAQLAFSQPVLVVTSLVLADMRAGANRGADEAPASVVTMSSDMLRPADHGAAAMDPRGTLALMRQRIEGLPGVESATIHTSGRGESFTLPGSGQSAVSIRQIDVAPHFFSTYGIPLIRGRAIAGAEDRRGSPAVVINQEAATLLWPGQDPIGKRLVRRGRNDKEAPATLEIIGVAAAAPYADDAATPQVFAPIANAASVFASIIAVRTSGDGRRFVPQVRAAIREVEPYSTVGNVSTLAERSATRRREAMEANAAAFAVSAAALLLASLGLYAIIAFTVAQRTREIGVRLAMGATPAGIVRHFFRHGVVVSAIGLAIGLPATVAGIRIVQANVVGFTLQNVLAVIVVVPVLIIIAGLASWLPARRAGRVDPLIALRSE